MIRDTSLCGLGQSAPNSLLTTLAPFPPRVRGPHPRQALPRRRLPGPGAVAVREQLPAAHEHPALPPALQGGPARRRLRVRDHGQSACPPRPAASASIRATTAAAVRRSTNRSTCAKCIALIADSILHDRPVRAGRRPTSSPSKLPPSGASVAVVGGGPGRADRGLLSGAARARVTVFDSHAEAGGMLRYRAAGISAAQDGARSRDRDHPPPGRGVRLQHSGRRGRLAQRSGRRSSMRCSCRSAPGRNPGSICPAPSSPACSARAAVPRSGGDAAIRRELGDRVVSHRRRQRRHRLRPAPPSASARRRPSSTGASARTCPPSRRKSTPPSRRACVSSLPGRAPPHRRRTRRGQGDRGGQDPPRRIRFVRAAAVPSTPTKCGSIRCSSVILAVGEAVDRDFCAASGLSVKENGVLEVDRYTLETSREKFFAGGDLVTGASNVSNAMGYGKEAARNIDARSQRASRGSTSILPKFAVRPATAGPPIPAVATARATCPRQSGAKTFDEADVRASRPKKPREEACRCLRCDIRETGIARSRPAGREKPSCLSNLGANRWRTLHRHRRSDHLRGAPRPTGKPSLRSATWRG